MVNETQQPLSARQHLARKSMWQAASFRIGTSVATGARGLRQPSVQYRVALLLAALLAVLLGCALAAPIHERTVVLFVSTLV